MERQDTDAKIHRKFRFDNKVLLKSPKLPVAGGGKWSWAFGEKKKMRLKIMVWFNADIQWIECILFFLPSSFADEGVKEYNIRMRARAFYRRTELSECGNMPKTEWLELSEVVWNAGL